jgi:hypothetical protein
LQLYTDVVEEYHHYSTPRVNQKATEAVYFENLLRAMYNKAFKFDSCLDFLATLRLADFYCALPVFSCHLDRAFASSKEFVERIRWQLPKLFVAAKQVRSAVLYRECMAYIAGDHQNSTPQIPEIDDPVLLDAIKIARERLRELVMDATAKIMLVSAEHPLALDLEFKLRREHSLRKWNSSSHEDLNIMRMGHFFRAMERALENETGNKYDSSDPVHSRSVRSSVACEAAIRVLSAIVELQLPLRRAFMNDEERKDFFILSRHIPDNELPWDMNATDW